MRFDFFVKVTRVLIVLFLGIIALKPILETQPAMAQMEDPYSKGALLVVECMGKNGDLAKCDAAISEFTKAIKADPKHTWAYLNRGDAYRVKGDKAKAMEDYNCHLSHYFDQDYQIKLTNNMWPMARREDRGCGCPLSV